MKHHRGHTSTQKHHRRSQTKRRPWGFTIIEVMIVLAVAGLIFIIILFAVPSAKRSARDTDRKQAASYVMAQLESYRTNNALAYPSTADRCLFLKGYLQDYVSPSATCVNNGCVDGILVHGYVYDFCFHQADISPHDYLGNDKDQISIQTGHWCANPVGVTNNSGDLIKSISLDTDLKYGVVWVPLEQARAVCVDNH